jgi:hypothetical protein
VPIALACLIVFSLLTSTADPGTQGAVRRLLMELSSAADEGRISWAGLQVKVVVANEVADTIEQAARYSGTGPSSRPV